TAIVYVAVLVRPDSIEVLLVRRLVAVRANPSGKSTFLDCSNGLTYHVAKPEEEILHDFDGYEY
ncbi:MAG: hypothetical protein VB131_03045, partial [Burkholderia gladioli]